MKTETKTNPGNFFEDFRVGQEIRHAVPRTITTGDVALYTALYGTRYAVNTSDRFAADVGMARGSGAGAVAPVDDLITFNVVFGKTVPDISLNAIANPGYAGGRFHKPVYPGDTLSAASRVTGLKENSNRKTGVVHVHSKGVNQHGETVLEYNRWVMVRKRDEAAAVPPAVEPDLPKFVKPEDLDPGLPVLDTAKYDLDLAGSRHRWGDYEKGERIDHVDGMTIEESDHQLATRLYQNTAKVHFNLHTERQGRFGKRIVYGGHVISLARSLAFNGLANAIRIVAINGGRHVAPSFAGDTIYCWSEILDKAEIKGRKDVAALRVRLVATKDRPCHDYPGLKPDGSYEDGVVLDLDTWMLAVR
jgi:2-methylfumaryl-CoA hydratase